jgi:hypothetical protein
VPTPAYASRPKFSKETHIRVSYQIALSDKAKPVPEVSGARDADEFAAAAVKASAYAAARRRKSPTLAEIADAQSESMDWASAISDEQF